MIYSDISSIRLINQRVASAPVTSVQELVSHMGAMQAQHYNMAKWAMGIRLPGSTLETIEAAITSGKIIRTHLLRPTWHVVSTDDLRWILALTAPRIKLAMRSRHKQLGITDVLVADSKKIIRNALIGNHHLTRKKLIEKLDQAGINTGESRGSHLLLCAELDGLICSGATQRNTYTYALFDERVHKTEKLNREEALAKLAGVYLNSHGPATLEDFTWWSGLTKTGARKAFEMIGPDFISERIESQVYWFSSSFSISKFVESAYLLPAYDEFLISYKNRSAVIMDKDHKKAISNNGIFRPVIVIDGQVAGIWKRTLKKQHVLVETTYFKKPTLKEKLLVEHAAQKFAVFWDKDLEIKQL